MSRLHYEGEEQFRPLSAWAYVGYTILFGLPLIGFVLMIVFALSDGNINRRNYARSFLCWLLIGTIVGIALIVTGSVGAIQSYMRSANL